MNWFNKSSFLSALLGGLVGACIVGFLVGVAWYIYSPSLGQSEAKYQPISEKLLADYQCPRGQIKKIIRRGVDDNYDQTILEPAHMHERLMRLPGLQAVSKLSRQYDEAGYDAFLVDFMEIPIGLSQALFVVGLRGTGNDNTDGIMLGDLSKIEYEGMYIRSSTSSDMISKIKSGRWKNNHDVYWIELANLIQTTTSSKKFPPLSILEMYQKPREDGSETAILDILIHDDTQVDFTALAYCLPPRNDHGLTLSEYLGKAEVLTNIALLSCDYDMSQMSCNAFSGDTPCSSALPLACYKDQNLSLPTIMLDNEVISRHWAGGELSYSSPVRGDQFETINDANAFCAKEFGANWRVAAWHDGGMKSISFYTKKRHPGQRSWIDIKDQPYGTCWGR